MQVRAKRASSFAGNTLIALVTVHLRSTRRSPPDPPKFDIEREKHALEREKLDLERKKAKWTAIAVGVPLVVAAISFAASLLVQALQADAQFQLKAAELIIATDDPLLARSRAQVLQTLLASAETAQPSASAV